MKIEPISVTELNRYIKEKEAGRKKKTIRNVHRKKGK